MKKMVVLVLGLVFSAYGFQTVLIPMHINVGGFTGLSTMLYDYTGMSFVVSSLLLNGPLFMWAFMKHGWRDTLGMIVCCFIFNALIDYAPPLPFMVANITGIQKLGISIFAGCFTGIGLGLLIRGGGSSGGSDLVSEVVNYYYPKLSRGLISSSFNVAIVALTAVVYGIPDLLLAILTTVVLNESINITLYANSHNPLPKSLQLFVDMIHRASAMLARLKTQPIAQPIAQDNFGLVDNLAPGDVLYLEHGNKKLKLSVLEVLPN